VFAEHNTERVACQRIPLPDGNTRRARRDDIIHIDERDFSVCSIPPTIADISSGRTGGRARLNCNKNEVGTTLVGQGVARALGDLRFEKDIIERDTDRCNHFPFPFFCFTQLVLSLVEISHFLSSY